MADKLRHDGETPAGPPVTVDVAHTKTRVSLSKIPPQLSEKEFASRGAQKLLREEIDRLDDEVSKLEEKLEAQASKLKESENRYHVADKKVAELETEAKASKEAHTLRELCLIMGAVQIGLATAAWLAWPGQAFLIGIGLLIIAVGMLTRRSTR
jgi:septal ring factor EnvC (AmiA/AmiB activator)